MISITFWNQINNQIQYDEIGKKNITVRILRRVFSQNFAKIPISSTLDGWQRM